MSTPPRIEARVSAQERRQLAVDTRIEEVAEDITHMDARIGEQSRDMTASFKQLVDYHVQQENQIDTRFNQVKAEIIAAKNEIKSEIKNDITAMENRILETTKNDMTAMENRILDATKNDMTAMENRILGAFKQLLAVITPQRSPLQ